MGDLRFYSKGGGRRVSTNMDLPMYDCSQN